MSVEHSWTLSCSDEGAISPTGILYFSMPLSYYARGREVWDFFPEGSLRDLGRLDAQSTSFKTSIQLRFKTFHGKRGVVLNTQLQLLRPPGKRHARERVGVVYFFFGLNF